MNVEEMERALAAEMPPEGWSAPMRALWWDAKGDWVRAHGMVDELETPEAMAVHAYLHRKEGVESNAEYWYARAGRQYRRDTLQEEWVALVEGLEPGTGA
jgi:hypothetical protein